VRGGGRTADVGETESIPIAEQVDAATPFQPAATVTPIEDDVGGWDVC